MMHPWTVGGRSIVLGLLAMAVVVAACGGCDEAESLSPAATHDLAEPLDHDAVITVRGYDAAGNLVASEP
jgi:hypothetical protein